jgi:hypothetical protein
MAQNTNDQYVVDVEAREREIDRRVQDYLTSHLLTDEELRAIRTLLEQDARTRWLWSTARTWLLFIAAAVTGLTLGLDALKAIARKLIA